MKHVEMTAVKAAKVSDRRALAILAFDNATAEPESANWRGVAELLRLALPASKAKVNEPAADSPYAPWADYSIPQSASGKRLGKSPVVIVTFADGEIVRAPAVSLPGKPVNIGRALRIAVAFYQGRMVGRYNADLSAAGRDSLRFSVTDSAVSDIRVPSIVSAICETNGAAYDPAECSASIGAAPVAPSPIEAPVAPSQAIAPDTANFAPARRYLVSSSLVRDLPLVPVAPSCVLLVA